MSTSNAPFFRSFPPGDDDSFSWSTRVCRGADQFLKDVESEGQYKNHSQALRAVIQFAWTWWAEIADKTGHTMTARLRARLEFDAARRNAEDRREALAQLANSNAEIQAADDPVIKAELLRTAQQLAATWRFPWPPPAVPLIQRDDEAHYVYSVLIKLLGEQKQHRVALREVERRARFDKEHLLEVLERLRVEGYVILADEQRSGLPTTWVAVPALEVKRDLSVSAVSAVSSVSQGRNMLHLDTDHDT